MSQFSKESLNNLKTCHPDLQILARTVILNFDISVTEGYRGQKKQDAAFKAGHSKLQYPESKHNKHPSEAIHFLPYPFHGWDNSAQFIYMAGYIMSVADILYDDGDMSRRLRWGGNWDRDNEVVTDQGFDDLAHFELVEDE